MKQTIHRLARRGLPSSLKKRIVSWATKLDNDAFHKQAYELAFAPNMKLGLASLTARGFQPKQIVDIGAYHGEWSMMAREIWPDAAITMLEANSEKEEILSKVQKDIGARLEFGVLGPEDGLEVVFHVMESGSSVFPENSPLDRHQVTLKTKSLDSILKDTSPDFIKIDVQGYELEVLKGASKCLTTAQGVLLEVSLIEINSGSPLLAQRHCWLY